MHRKLAGTLTSKTTKWMALIFWVALTALAVPLSDLKEIESNDAISWLPGSAESTQALDQLASFQDPNQLDAVVVYERQGGLTEADAAKVDADVAAFTELDGVVKQLVRGPVPSPDGEAFTVQIPLDLGPNGWEKAGEVIADMRETATADADGLASYFTGPAGNAADQSEAFEGIDGTLLYSTIAVVVVILLLTYRSPILWLLPVISAGIALTCAQAVIYLLAKHADLTVNAQTTGILTVLVFGAGTDYALLLVARYREELRRHHDRHEAMAEALHRAGPAIIASAGTVILGMLCLVFADMNSTQGLGPVAAIGIAVGLLVMVTLLPALLVITGRWVFWPKIPHEGSAEPTASGIWSTVGSVIARRPRAVWVVTSVLLGVASLGIVQLDADGLSTDEQFTETVQSVTGEHVLAEHFPAGAADPALIVAKASAVGQVVEAAQVAGVSDVGEPRIAGDLALITATTSVEPLSQAGFEVIERLRDAVHRVDGADALVGGNAAIQLDSQDASTRDAKVLIPIILIAVLAVLMLLLRAIVAPLVLIATVVLSFGAALGLSALAFRHIFDWAGADASLPLFVFVFLVALGIDYNIFLMTRVREEAGRFGTRRGALIGLAATGGVITSAGLVLAGTFAVLGTMPVVAFAEIGFAVALGVLLDTIVVRSVLVTGLNLDIGRHMWWPNKLSAKEDIALNEIRQDDRALVNRPV